MSCIALSCTANDRLISNEKCHGGGVVGTVIADTSMVRRVVAGYRRGP